MTTIGKQIFRERDLTVNTVRGTLQLRHVQAALDEFYEVGPTTNVIWDMREADSSALAWEDLRAIVEHARSYADQREGGRTAFVVASDFAYGVCRMYTIMADVHDHPIGHGTFRTLEEAEAWLRGEAKEQE